MGLPVGCPDGCDGILVGWPDGCMVGWLVGCDVGCPVGFFVKTIDAVLNS